MVFYVNTTKIKLPELYLHAKACPVCGLTYYYIYIILYKKKFEKMSILDLVYHTRRYLYYLPERALWLLTSIYSMFRPMVSFILCSISVVMYACTVAPFYDAMSFFLQYSCKYDLKMLNTIVLYFIFLD